jgi:endonuclease/exonuclease/phosphatase family metal-dependent hydrolase
MQNASCLSLMSFNVLAPCWAHPSRYPSESAELLERTQRQKRVLKILEEALSTVDVIALQETTPKELDLYQRTLHSHFHTFHVFHDKNYWSNWKKDGVSWEQNGVALFVKKERFPEVKFKEFSLSASGNHAAYFEALDPKSKQVIRGVSVHLDSDHLQTRTNELNDLMIQLKEKPHCVDVILGDLNDGTRRGPLQETIEKNSYQDVLAFLKQETWTSVYFQDHAHAIKNSKDFGIIDHLLVRNGTPLKGQVQDFNLWSLYPDHQAKRIYENLKLCGSDHFPIYGEIKL